MVGSMGIPILRSLFVRSFVFALFLVRHLSVARGVFETRAAFIHVLNLVECLGTLALRMRFINWFGYCWPVLFSHSWSCARSSLHAAARLVVISSISSALFVARIAFETRAAFFLIRNLLECFGVLAPRMPFVKLFGNCWTVLLCPEQPSKVFPPVWAKTGGNMC